MSGPDRTHLPAKIQRSQYNDWPGYDKWEVQERFIQALRMGGSVARAVEFAQVESILKGRVVRRPTKMTFYNWRRDDDEFREMWDEAFDGALGALHVNLHKLALHSRRDEVQLNAAKFLLAKLDRARFGDEEEKRPTNIVVRVNIPQPAKPEDLEAASEDEIAALLGVNTLEASGRVIDEDGVPE